jgi:L-Ala-D/L-Glu epimerase
MLSNRSASLASTITQLDLQPLDLALTEPFAISGGAPSVARNVLVRVTLADGTVGLGEAAPFPAVSGETQASTLLALNDVRPRLLGQDVRALRHIAALLSEVCPDEPAARAGCEMALLDALLQQHRLPMWSFFGGQTQTLLTDLTITAGDTPHAVAATQAALSRGFSTLKIKVGASSVAADVERVVAMHRVVQARGQGASGVQFVLDANGGYSADQALTLLAELAAAGVPVALFEQPVSRADRLGLLEVARLSPVPICADESARSAADVLWLVQSRVVRAVNLKLMKSGLFETLAMYEIARSAGLLLMMGGMVEGPLAMSAAAHMAAGLGGFSFVDLDTALFVASHPFLATGQQRDARWDLHGVSAGHGVSLAREP